jgi:hypothetical protein
MRAALLLSAGLLACASGAEAQGFNDWLNARLDSLVAMRIAVRDASKQPLIPVGSTSEASLVDRAAMPDIAGISIQLPDMPGSADNVQTTTASLSGTVYMVLALLKGRGLDPGYYLRNAIPRRFGFSATFDTDTAGRTTTLVQAKVIVLDRGNPLAADSTKRVSATLARATDAFGRITTAVQDILWERVGRETGEDQIDFLNSLTEPVALRNALAVAGQEGRNAIDHAIEEQLASFEALRTVVDSLKVEARRRPQLSIGLIGNTGGVEPDRVRAVAIFDLARAGVDVTLNAGYEFVQAASMIAAQHRLEAAGQLYFRLTRDDVLGRSPMTLALAGSGSFNVEGNHEKIFRVQSKLVLPVADGFDVPLSVTWASRTELIDEAEIRGHAGFTVDVTRLLALLK